MSGTVLPIAEALSGQYDIERELGRGGMATVYLAEDRKHRRRVAIKVLDPFLSAGAERFLREIEIIARLSHPHILPLFDSGQAGQFLYYVMPFIAGDSLRARLRSETRLPLDEAVRLTRQVADALDYAHSEGVIHRDIKPENILLSRGHALVADFGIARALSAASDATHGEVLTHAGVALGTPTYMSPEQAMGERELGASTDVYALGCVLFEMLGGEPPFAGATPAAVIAKRLSGPTPSICRTRSDIPPLIDEALDRALARDPRDRFASIAEFAACLAQLTSSSAAFGAAPIREAPKRTSIAVLPFSALSAGTDDDYLSDGITEDIITRLGRVGALKVISRTSVMRFKNTTQSMRAIADALGVATVLQGSVRCAGDRLRVTAQLIDAVTDEHLWADSYDRKLVDVFEVQADVAEAIVHALHTRLSSAERERLRQRPSMDVETYKAYLRARHEIYRFTEPSLRRAEELLREALSRIGDNDLLYAALGETYFEYYNSGIRADEALLLEAEAFAAKAMTLNADSSHARFVRGLVAMKRGELTSAITWFKQALDHDPENTDALFRLAYLYGHVGRTEEARPLIARLLTLDPMTPINHAMAGFAELMAGHFADALPNYKRWYEMESDHALSTWMYAFNLIHNGREDEARTLFEKLPLSNPPSLTDRLGLALKFGLAGNAHAVQDLITEDVRAAIASREEFSYHAGRFYALAGLKMESVQSLRRAMDLGFINYPFVATHDPFLENVRGEPAFHELLRDLRPRWQTFQAGAAVI